MWIYTNEPTFINIVDIWYCASSKSKPAGLFMCMSRKGSFPHGEKREKHTSLSQWHRKGAKPLCIPAIANIGEYKKHFTVFPVLLNSCHLEYQDHWIPGNPAYVSDARLIFLLFLGEGGCFLVDFFCLWQNVTNVPEPFSCYGNITHMEVIHRVDMQNPCYCSPPTFSKILMFVVAML